MSPIDPDTGGVQDPYQANASLLYDMWTDVYKKCLRIVEEYLNKWITETNVQEIYRQAVLCVPGNLEIGVIGLVLPNELGENLVVSSIDARLGRLCPAGAGCTCVAYVDGVEAMTLSPMADSPDTQAVEHIWWNRDTLLYVDIIDITGAPSDLTVSYTCH